MPSSAHAVAEGQGERGNERRQQQACRWALALLDEVKAETAEESRQRTQEKPSRQEANEAVLDLPNARELRAVAQKHRT
jgi:hypothetical protein